MAEPALAGAIDVVITLGRDDLIAASAVGAERAVNYIERGIGNRIRGYDEDGQIWTRCIEGALGECAFSRLFNRPWQAATEPGDGDVERVEVRTTRRENAPLMILKHSLYTKRGEGRRGLRVPWVLMTGRAPTYTFRGWIWGWEAAEKGEWEDRFGVGQPQLYVPQAMLRPAPR